MKDKKPFPGLIIVLIAILFLSGHLYPSDFEVIKNPQPTMLEENYVELKLVKTLDLDLGNDEYIFQPFSLTMDEEGNLYVYDKVQTRIFVFNRDLKYKFSFGSKGQGPGEFFGRISTVFLNIGKDGNLYAKDILARKILVFKKNGQYHTDIRTRDHMFSKPIVDAKGRYYYTDLDENNRLDILDQDKTNLLSLEIEKRDLSFLFYDPKIIRSSATIFYMDFVGDGNLLLYHPFSSTLLKTRDGALKCL